MKMSNKKCLLIIILLFVVISMASCSKHKRYDTINFIEVYDVSELTGKILEDRNGKIIIEKIIGVVENTAKDGKIFNNEPYDYISYKDVKDANVGDIVLTYLIYNPNTNYVDDILCRFDYIISDITD